MVLSSSRENATRLVRVLGHRYTSGKSVERFETEKDFLETLKNQAIKILKETPRPQPLNMENIRILKKKLDDIINYVAEKKIIDKECPPFAPENEIEKLDESGKSEIQKIENVSSANEGCVTVKSQECASASKISVINLPLSVQTHEDKSEDEK